MERAMLDDVALDYEIRGSGEPVVFIHNGVLADWFAPLLDQPALVDRCRILRYHRAGYAGSGPLREAGDFTDHARQCRALLQHVGMRSAHVVAHSSGGAVALQLALDWPEVVHSLALLEPALPSLAPSGPYAPEAAGRFRDGDASGAVDTFLKGVFGPGYRPALDQAIPGAFEQAVRDAGTFFGQESPALLRFPFAAPEAERVTQPVLAVLGARSDDVSPAFRQRFELLLTLLPDVEPFVLPDANHLMDVQNPRGLAEGLAAFIDTHRSA